MTQREKQIAALEKDWNEDPRWKGLKRGYSAADVVRLRGSVMVEHTLAKRGAEKLWRLMHERPFVNSLGALTGNQAVQQVKAGVPAIYLSGWQVAADANDSLQMYPDQSLYAVSSVPTVVRRINNALTQVTSEETLTAPSLEPGIAAALTRAAPVYRAHGWTRQKKINEGWIAALRPLMDRHASAMAAAIARVYRVDWPDRPIIVDAAAEAGPGGGYTTFGPPATAAHTVIAAGDPGYQGEMAFEMVFHEASHAQAFAVFVIVDAAAKKQQVTPPRDLSHVLLFYTAGELARRELGKPDDDSYKPYADRYGVYDHGWQQLRDAVVTHWRPYLDGKTDFDAALAALTKE